MPSHCPTCDGALPAAASPAAAPPHARAAWPAVGAVAVGTFVMVSTEFMPIGLLTDIARGLQVSDGVAGLMVTMPGVLAALAGPALSVAAGRLDRRTVMLALTALLLASNLLAALAPDFATMLLARLMLGAAVGGFWTFAPGVAGQMVSPAAQARALSLVLAGVSVSTVLGVPAGSLLGSLAGWRFAFAASAALTLAVQLAQWRLLPALPPARAIRPADLLTPLRRARPRAVLVAVVLMVMGHFAAYTYLKPLLLQVFALSATQVTALLLTYGAAGFAGNFLVGLIVARSARAGMMATTALLALALLASTLAGSGFAAAAAVVLAWGVAFGMVPGAATGWMLRSLPDAPEAGQAMLVTAFQVAIASGATLGGRVVDGSGVPGAMLLGAALVAAALAAATTLGRGRAGAAAVSAP